MKNFGYKQICSFWKRRLPLKKAALAVCLAAAAGLSGGYQLAKSVWGKKIAEKEEFLEQKNAEYQAGIAERDAQIRELELNRLWREEQNQAALDSVAATSFHYTPANNYLKYLMKTPGQEYRLWQEKAASESRRQIYHYTERERQAFLKESSAKAAKKIKSGQRDSVFLGLAEYKNARLEDMDRIYQLGDSEARREYRRYLRMGKRSLRRELEAVSALMETKQKAQIYQEVGEIVADYHKVWFLRDLLRVAAIVDENNKMVKELSTVDKAQYRRDSLAFEVEKIKKQELLRQKQQEAWQKFRQQHGYY